MADEGNPEIPRLTRNGKPICTGTTKDGQPCSTPAQVNGLCIGHYNSTQPPEVRSEGAKRAGSAPKTWKVNLHTPEHVLDWLEETASEMTRATADIVEARVRLCMAALKCQEAILARGAVTAEEKAKNVAITRAS